MADVDIQIDEGTVSGTIMEAELFKLVMPLTVNISITSNSAACETEVKDKINRNKILLIKHIYISLNPKLPIYGINNITSAFEKVFFKMKIKYCHQNFKFQKNRFPHFPILDFSDAYRNETQNRHLSWKGRYPYGPQTSR